jgi:hypothetical protein
VVQVDVFWSYAIGAGFGAAAAALRESRAAARDGGAAREHGHSVLGDRDFTVTVLFLACVFAPSGIWLLWRFTGWETMHAAVVPADLPGWLVAAFALTNVTQGVVGYLVAQALWRRGRRYLSWLQMPFGYLAMFFVLAYGWDGTGYQRFFSSTPAAWRAGAWDPGAFLTSDVALTLYAMGVVLVPPMLWLQSDRWHRARPSPYGRARFTALILAAVLVLGLGTAVAAATALTLLGPVLGGLACVPIVAAALHSRAVGGVFARAFSLDGSGRLDGPPERDQLPR